MSDASLREESGSDAEPTGIDSSGQSRLAAATDVWYVWVAGVVALALGVYFSRTEGIWTNYGETFYALVFLLGAVVALFYGTYTVYDRSRPV